MKISKDEAKECLTMNLLNGVPNQQALAEWAAHLIVELLSDNSKTKEFIFQTLLVRMLNEKKITLEIE